jgi:hypothetical protein
VTPDGGKLGGRLNAAQHMAHSLLFLNAAGRAEDSGVARPYEFAHALHRHMIYEQIPDRRRQRRLDGHLKSGHRGTGQNRPKGRAPKPLVL